MNNNIGAAAFSLEPHIDVALSLLFAMKIIVKKRKKITTTHQRVARPTVENGKPIENNC